MIKRTIATLLMVLSLTSTVAMAKIVGNVVKVNNTNYVYDLSELRRSAFIANESGKGDKKLFLDFKDKLSKGKYVAYKDDSGKYVSYDDVVSNFLDSTKRGQTFNINDYVKNAKGYTLNGDVVEVSGEQKNIQDKDKVWTKAEMLPILEDFTGGLYVDKVRTYREIISSKQSLNSFDGDNMESVDRYYNTIKTYGKFSEKYNNSEYADITDLDNYKRLPNLTINFDKLNNKNKYDLGKHLFIHTKDENKDELPNIDQKYVKRGGAYKWCRMYGEEPKQWAMYINVAEDSRFGNIIWRPDIENEMVEEINKIRKSKGMQPLTVTNDLKAMAKYSAKRSHYGYNTDDGKPMSTLPSGMFLPGVYKGDVGRTWMRGSLPFAKAYKDVNNLNFHYYKGGAYQDTKNVNYDFLTKIEGNEKELFGYNKPVKAISEASCYFTTAKEFLEAWATDKSYLSELFNEKYPNEYIHNKEYRIGGSDASSYYKYDNEVNLEGSIYDSNMKYIGVGSVYASPMNETDINGSLGVFVIVSK